jgi:uncharacterized membrane protein
MLALVAAVVAAVIFILGGFRVIEDTADVAWLYMGLFFLALSLVLGSVGDRWPARRP